MHLSPLIQGQSWILNGVPGVCLCLRIRLTGFGNGCGPMAVLPRNDVCRGRTRRNVRICASSAEAFPGLSFSRRGRRSNWENRPGMALSSSGVCLQYFLGAVFNSRSCQVDQSPTTLSDSTPDSSHCGGFCPSLQGWSVVTRRWKKAK